MKNQRDEFKARVFERDNGRCVACGDPAADAHHIIDRSLWADGGYLMDNLVSLCSTCHLNAETTELTCEELRKNARIYRIVLPDHLPQDNAQRYDKWANLYFDKVSPRRIPGELFHQENVQRILKAGKQLEHFEQESPKYPRTYHLDWSLSLHNDDRRLPTTKFLENEEIVVTEKMDGENTTMTAEKAYARSPDAKKHPSRDWVRQLHARICFDIPQGWRICGENMYARHSIAYDSLPSYFMVFNIWDERNWTLSWDNTLEWAELMDVKTVPVLYRGPWDEGLLKELAQECETKREKVEGYVVRATRSFPFTHFGHRAAKYVRAKHVNTSTHWMSEEIVPNKLA